MASRKEKQRILSGGLSLLPPGDKLNDGEALLLDNWRVDQVGELRSRKGSIKEAGPVGSGVFHTLARAGADRYAGIGTELRWGLALGTTVSTGFDGNPLGIAFYQGAAWVMNRNKQLRVVGATPQKWGIAAPSTAPTATALEAVTITLEPFNSLAAVPLAGYWNQGAFTNYPLNITVLSNAGTIGVTQGSTAVVGTGTNFTQSMAGAALEITTPGTVLPGGNPLLLSTYLIASVQDATHLTLSVGVDTLVGWPVALSYQIISTGSAVQFNATPSALNPSLTVAALVTSTVAFPWSIIGTYSPGFDSRITGVANDQDTFLFPFYADDPSQIDSISIKLVSDQNVGATPPSVSVTIPGSMLSQAHQSVSNISVRRAVNFDLTSFIASNHLVSSAPIFDANGQLEPDIVTFLEIILIGALSAPHFIEYLGGAQNTNFGPTFTPAVNNGAAVFGASGTPVTGSFPFNWANITDVVVTVWLKGPTTFGLDAATITGNPSVSFTGSVSYFVSFANAIGEDSNPSPVATVSVNQQDIQLTAIPVSTDPQVTERWIYRLGGGLSTPLLVGKISDNVSTGPWTDNTSNTSAQNTNAVMPTNRTLPPAARGVVGPYLGRLIAFTTDAHPARYFWSPVAQPWFFPGSDENDEGNWEDAGNDDDAMVMCTDHKRLLVIYKQRSIWRLVGDADSSDAEKSNANVGLVGPRAVANAGVVDYFMGAEGVYVFNGDFEMKISQALDPIFKGDSVLISNGEYLPPIDPSNIGTSVLELVNGRLRVSYPELGQTQPNVLAIYNMETGKWAREKYTNLPAPAPTAMHYEGSGYSLMAGFTGGYLYRLENGAVDDGSAIHLAWQSRFSDQGLPDNHKWYSDVEIDFQTAVGSESPSTLTVYLLYDNGTKVTLGTISSATRTTVGFPLQSSQDDGTDYGLRAKNAAIRIEGDATSTCIVHGMYLHWYPEERLGQSFDTGPLKTERVRQIDYLEFELTATGGTGACNISSDLPGNLIAQRLNPSLALPTRRGVVRQRLSSIVEGRLTRLTLAPPAGASFKVHAARIRQREVGEYVDGSIGEYWESPEFSVQPGRVGELKDFLLDYDSSGAGGQLLVYSDLPNHALQVVRTIAIPQRSTRAPFVFALEDSSDALPYGQLFKVRVIPPPGGVTRLHGRAVFRARLIGTFFDGSAGEIWETQPLDLLGGTGLFREIALVAQNGGPMLFEAQFELPEEDVRTRSSFSFDTTQATVNREPIYFRLPGNAKGRLQKFRISGANVARIFEVKVYARGLGNVAGPWQWINVPLEATPDEFTQIQMPVHETPPEFTWVDLPVDAVE